MDPDPDALYNQLALREKRQSQQRAIIRLAHKDLREHGKSQPVPYQRYLETQRKKDLKRKRDVNETEKKLGTEQGIRRPAV